MTTETKAYTVNAVEAKLACGQQWQCGIATRLIVNEITRYSLMVEYRVTKGRGSTRGEGRKPFKCTAWQFAKWVVARKAVLLELSV